jgi:threonine/homoserine/homoserine lactone efflux protein
VSKKYVIKEEKDHSDWWVILVAAFIVAYGYVIITVATILGILYLAYLFWKWYQPRRKQVEETNNYFDPPTRLITEGMRVWGNPEHYLHDYEDGMREWV